MGDVVNYLKESSLMWWGTQDPSGRLLLWVPKSLSAHSLCILFICRTIYTQGMCTVYLQNNIQKDVHLSSHRSLQLRSCGGAGLISACISQQLSILEGIIISVEQSKLQWYRFHFTYKNRWEMWNECNLRVITMRDEAFPFHSPVNSGDRGGTQI